MPSTEAVLDKPAHRARRRLRTWGFTAAVLAVVAAGIQFVVFAPVATERHVVALGAVRREVLGTGTLEAPVRASVSTKIAGRIHVITVDQGDRVSRGKPLIVLDDADLQQEVAVAEAVLEERQAGFDRAQADVQRAEAVLSQARKDHERVAALVQGKVVPPADLDKARETLDIAQAERERAGVAVIEARARIGSAQRTLELQRARREETQIVSPIDGLVVVRSREPGDVVVPGSPILELVATQELWVSAWVDESTMTEIAAGQVARVVFRSEPAATYAGEVVRASRSVDRESREFLVDVRMKSLPAQWAVGQRAEVFVQTAEKQAVVVVPARFLIHHSGRPGVFVEEGGRARWRELTLGIRGEGAFEVLAGLVVGQTVLSAGLTEGARVSR